MPRVVAHSHALRAARFGFSWLGALVLFVACSAKEAESDGAPADDGPQGAGGVPAASEVAFPAALLERLAFRFDPTSLVQTDTHALSWTDLSGQAHHAAQTDAAFAPTYVAVGIGGLPSAQFDAPTQFLRIADGDGMRWGTDDFVLLAVERANDQTGGNAMVYQKTGDVPYDGVSLFLNSSRSVEGTRATAQVTGEVYVVSEGEPSTFVDDTLHVLVARRAGTRLELRVDGAVSAVLDAAAVNQTNVDAAGYDGIIGANGYATTTPNFQQFRGQLAEVVAVRGPTSDAEVQELEAYLMERYGI